MVHSEQKYLASTIEILSLYVDLGQRKVSEFEDDKIKLMEDFISKNKNISINNPLEGSFANVCIEFNIPDLTKKVPVTLEMKVIIDNIKTQL